MMHLRLNVVCLRLPVMAAALLLFLIAAPSLRALDPAQPLRQYGQQLWQTDNGLPQNTVHAIRQTHDGYLWLATDGGLVRFDGIEFTLFDRRSTPRAAQQPHRYPHRDERRHALGRHCGRPASPRAKARSRCSEPPMASPLDPSASVIPAGNSSLWVLTPEGVAFGSETTSPLCTASMPRSQAVMAHRLPRARQDGSLWLTTARNVLQLRDGRIVTTLPGSADLVAVAHDGSLWLTREGSLFHYQQGVLAPLPFHPPAAAKGGLPDNAIRALCPTNGGALYLATSGALGIVSSGTFTWKTTADGLPAGRILHLFEDRRGALWLSTENTVARYAAGRFETLRARSGAAGIEAFYEDREGNMWLGTEAAGLLELREQRFTTLTTADGLPTDAVRTILADKDSIWAGTDGNGLAHLSGSAWQTLTTQQGLASNAILSLAAERDGSLAVGTPDGLSRLTNGRAAPAQHSDTLPDDFVRSLLYDPADNSLETAGGSLWIGTRRGLAHQGASGLTLWSRSNGLGSDLVGALALDPAHPGALWIGTRGGLSHLENGRISNLTTRDGLSSNIVTALYADPSGALWIGTNGGGLNLLRNGHITVFPSSSTGLPEVIHSSSKMAAAISGWAPLPASIPSARPELDAFASHYRSLRSTSPPMESPTACASMNAPPAIPPPSAHRTARSGSPRCAASASPIRSISRRIVCRLRSSSKT